MTVDGTAVISAPARQDPPHPALAGRLRVAANSRLTAMSAIVLSALFCIQITTVVLGVKSVLTLHVVIGLLLVPPLLVKIGSVSWRFIKYYQHDPAFRQKGPPTPVMRLLSPLLLLVTVVLFVSGIVLLLAPSCFGGSMRQIHGGSFFIWLLLVLVHVVAHAKDIRRVAPRDWVHHSRQAVPGALVRQMVVLGSLAVGLVLALTLVSRVGTYRHEVHQTHAVSQRSASALPGSPGRSAVLP
jgi:hypothetical protein